MTTSRGRGGSAVVTSATATPGEPITTFSRRQRMQQAFRPDRLVGQFNLLTALAVGLALLSMLIAYLVLNANAANFKRAVNDSTPSIIAANEMGQALNFLDTNTADFQVTLRADPSGNELRTVREGVLADYYKNRDDFSERLFRAHDNITFPGEAETIKTISTRFYDYLGLIEQMRYELDRGNREVGLALYKRAHDIVIGNLNNVPLQNGHTPEEILRQNGWANLRTDQAYLGLEANIARLNKINTSFLAQANQDAANAANLSLVLVIVAGLVLSLTLAGLVYRYAWVTHRLLNPGYFVALVLSIVIFSWLCLTLFQANTDYKTLSRDSFISINAASRAKQLLLDFNGDESRLLLSPDGPGLAPDPALTAQVKAAFSSSLLAENFKSKQAQLEEQLKIAWGNVTYQGERQALCGIADNTSANGPKCRDTERLRDSKGSILAFALNSYLEQHQRILTLYSQGSLAQAIGVSFGPSNQAASSIRTQLDQLGEVNRNYFDEAACSSIGVYKFKTNLACGQPGYFSLLQIVTVIMVSLLPATTLLGSRFIRRML